ncbi:hypothetical protein KY495_22745 [Massilia sp. PAMC28688]|uniref:hypothetical protein n=1 Tax=Massilia sp. PAMC28688 TaxID=2861283 RepID=UPI001C62B5D2|nr:hypothetical protein [Massilia sp. PAMC28688]QYF93449.1 hypothetical protein KY495_22745 [Massilia sp. PAMC28688]
MLNNYLRFATAATLSLAANFALATPASTRPLTVSGVFQEQVGPSLRCASKFGGNIGGFGDSAQLGRIAYVGSDCITPSGSMFVFSEGRFVIVTMTGEQIYASYGGQFVPTGEGANYVFNGATFRITGGSGRYFKATGGGTLNGGSNMITGSGTLSLDGKITY